MNEKKPTGQSIMNMIRSVIAVLIINCIFMASEAHADLDTFADEIQTRIWLDIQHFWDDDDDAAISAQSELNEQASRKIEDGLNEMFSGQNLDPGQRWIWRSTGVGGFRLDYPRPDYPEVAVKTVHYLKIGSGVLFAVEWDAHWTGLSHEVHNGPYIYFRITGGYLWARRHDVRIHIDRMDMPMDGTTWYYVRADGSVGAEPMYGGCSLGFEPHPNIYSIAYENPNPRRWRHRVGNRIIEEIRSNYSSRIKRLVCETLLDDFINWRMVEEIASDGDGFWERWRDWALREESSSGTYSFP